jgi:hypothetical protein
MTGIANQAFGTARGFGLQLASRTTYDSMTRLRKNGNFTTYLKEFGGIQRLTTQP